MKIIFIASIVFLCHVSTYSQWECYTIEEGSSASLLSTTCSEKDNYSPINNNYIPIKYVRLAIHIFQKTDGTGNWQNTAEHKDLIQGIIDNVNSKYGSLTDPNPGTSVHIPDSRIQFILDPSHIYFYQDDVDWDWSCAPCHTKADDIYNEYIVSSTTLPDIVKYNAINIFWGGNFTGAYSGAVDAIGHKTFVWERDTYYRYFSDLYGPSIVTNTTAHELGHCLNLRHNFQGGTAGDQCDDCNDNDDLYDCPLQGTSNNIMDYWPGSINSLSECQLEKAHWSLMGYNSGDISYALINDYCNIIDPEMVVNDPGNTIEWNHSVYIKGNIRITTGTTLVIRCRIGMPDDAKIIVERGARLVIDGGFITSNCGELWQGIEVYGAGNYVAHPTRNEIILGTHPMTSWSHGVVYIKNGGTIEYARNGITTSKYDEFYNTAYYGGVILATNANFINNRRSAEFMQYNYNNLLGADDNVSEFKECVFEVNDDYPCTETFYSHISMWNVHGVDFLGNTYKDLRETCTNSDTKAIYSIDATYKVASIPCPTPPDPCPVPLPVVSSFEGFVYPVFAANTTYLPRDIEISGNEFTDNFRAILLSGVKNSLVINNSFEVQDQSTLNCYGMYLESCENYHIENNYFTTFGSYINGSPFNAGIYVQNNSNAVTEIYRNNFEYLEAGIRSQGNNKKLQIKCNNFISVIRRHDIYVTSGELDDQGKCLSGIFSLEDRVQSPAGNTFSHDCYGTEGDLKVFPGLPSLIYKHHTPAAYIPQCFTTSLITLQDCNLDPDEGGFVACPSRLPDTGGGEEFMAGGGDGSAAAMLGEVNTINEKIEELYELIAAEDYTAEEMDSGDFAYEDDLAYLESEKETLLNEAVKLYVQEGKTDSAIAALSSLDASWAKERIVELFVLNADYEAALNALSEVNTDDVAGADFVSLHEIVISVAQEGRNNLQLNKDEQSALESFAGKQSPSGVAAENILEFAAGATYPEVFDAEMEDEELRFSASQSGEITIYPNPATNELFIQVNSANIFEVYSFEMYSITGTLILSGNLQQQELHALNLNSIPSGIYLIRVHTNGVTKHIEKIVKE